MIRITIRNIEPIKDRIDVIKHGFRGVAVHAANVYLIGNDQRGLRHYVNYRYVSRKSAFGQTFKSDRQRRFVMARIAEGSITPGRSNRTNGIKEGWIIQGSSTQERIVNAVPGVNYVFGKQQSRQIQKVGWRKTTDIIQTNIAGMARAAQLAINKLIQESK